MAVTKECWRELRDHACPGPDIFEDLDLAIHLHRLGRTVRYSDRLRAPVSARRIGGPLRDLYRYLRTWMHLRAARAAPGGRGGADVDVGWAGRALPAGGAAAARLCPGAGEAVAAPFVLPRGGTGVAAYPLTGGRVTGQSRGRQSALAPQITTHGSSPGTCPASQAAMGVAAAGSTAIRNLLPQQVAGGKDLGVRDEGGGHVAVAQYRERDVAHPGGAQGRGRD